MNKIYFHNSDKTVNLQNRIALKNFIPIIFTDANKSLDSLTYIFCSDEYLLTINKQFLKHNFYTDIVTFDLSESKKSIIGEIYISLDRIKDNSFTLGLTYKEELHRVMFHGALHLCGYKDKRKIDQSVMRRAEDYYLASYFK